MLSDHALPAHPNTMTRFRDLIQEYPYETVIEHTGLSREEINKALDDILRNLSPENKKIIENTEFLLDMEVDDGS